MQMNHSPDCDTDTIVQRLKKRIQQAKSLGFEIRNEWLDGLESTWCELGGVQILFLDLSKNAAEQLDQVNEAIAWHQQRSIGQATSEISANRAA